MIPGEFNVGASVLARAAVEMNPKDPLRYSTSGALAPTLIAALYNGLFCLYE
jgi:hypothetical protein